MYVIRLAIDVTAPIGRCFDLARSIDAHVQSTAGTGERAVAGRTSGLIEFGEEVTWEARHLGVRQRLTSRITAYDRPRYFQDRMVRGAFAAFEHDHFFEAGPGGVTTVTDVLRFSAPCGAVGWVVERVVLAGHLRRLLEERGRVLKALAESDGWTRFVPPG
jgi:ligand-binding SRPBCC domain-containing protein